ncbi:MAG: hypothetical protein ACI9FD_004373 [Gammaproteobacteria bacterium]|jgi:hypothetical protein
MGAAGGGCVALFLVLISAPLKRIREELKTYRKTAG